MLDQERTRARELLALFDRGAFKIELPDERTASLYRSLRETKIQVRKGGASTLLLPEISRLFGEITDILEKVLNEVNSKYPEVEEAAQKPGELTWRDAEELRHRMGQRYYDAANKMIGVRDQVEQRLGKIREDLLKPERPARPPTTKSVRLFYSYSHKDEKLREKLEEHLALLQRQGVIDGWHDRKIGAGEEWKGAIDENLDEARVILLLVSASFLASNYCYDVETKRAIERHDRGEARVISVILRPCDWQKSPIGKLQALPKDGRAVTSWKNRDEGWTDVAIGIRRAVEALKANPR